MIVVILSMLLTVPAQAHDTYVHGYTRSNGTYVQPHERTAPDHTNLNNYSTQGNVNPYTGTAGTKKPETDTNSFGGYKSNNSKSDDY
jgi:hypothetical protein